MRPVVQLHLWAASRPFRALWAVVFAVSALSFFSVSNAQSEPDSWALEIFDKEYNEETGELLLSLKNGSTDLDITAFGVLIEVFTSDGRSHFQIHGEELIPGDGILPGELYELTIAISREDQPSSRFAGRTLELHYEIRSDATSYGNEALIRDIFASRSAHFLEHDKALRRLREERRLGDEASSILPFLREEAKRAVERQVVFTEPTEPEERQKREHASAAADVADLADQFKGFIEAGNPIDEALDQFEWVLQHLRDRFSDNIPREELERLGPAPIP